MKSNWYSSIDTLFLAALCLVVAGGAFALWRVQQADITVNQAEVNTSQLETSLTKQRQTTEETTTQTTN